MKPVVNKTKSIRMVRKFDDREAKGTLLNRIRCFDIECTDRTRERCDGFFLYLIRDDHVWEKEYNGIQVYVGCPPCWEVINDVTD